MKDVNTWIVVGGVLSALCASGTANAIQVVYKLPVPPPEINADVYDGQGTVHKISPKGSPWTFVAAAKMGVKGYNAATDVTGVDEMLYYECVANTDQSMTDWPGGCDFSGMKLALAQIFPTQSWTMEKYHKGTTEQTMKAAQSAGINRMIDGLSIFKSPSLVPLYGKTDHWATVIEIKADKATTPVSLIYVRYYDAGNIGPDGVADPLNPWKDEAGFKYVNGLRLAYGDAWKLTYYALLSSPPGCAPLCDHFVVSIEPPVASPLHQTGTSAIVDQPPSNELIFARAPGVLMHDDEEMDAFVAEERVWDALYVAGIFDDNEIWNALATGRAGTAVPVYAENLDGEPMDYFLVPILDSQDELMAMVRLSMEDGGFEDLWIPTKPLPFMGVTPQEAEYFARQAISDDEMLIGGGLTWSARRSLGGSELLPYYEFQVLATSGESRGRIGVSHASGVVTGLDRSVARSAKVTR